MKQITPVYSLETICLE